jgi:quinol monooxygenase YgiN
MTHVIAAYWRPREGQTEKVEAILRELAPAARTEPGNLEFIVNRSHDNPNEFLLYE